MKSIKRKSVGTHFSMCVQPAFIIGTNTEDGTHKQVEESNSEIQTPQRKRDERRIPTYQGYVVNIKEFISKNVSFWNENVITVH